MAEPGDVRLHDPAHRDQDGVAWHRGRFEERVRRQWNAVPGADVAAASGDLDALGQAVHARVGGDLAEVRHRLVELQELDALAEPEAEDPLVRPGRGDQP